MNDCTNAEIRDQLPEFLHNRLDAAAHAAVTAHLERCGDCRDEVRLLGEVRSVLEARTPRVDLNYVVGALPKPPASRGAQALQAGVRSISPRRHVWSDWRVAAAVTLLVAGGSSVALLNRDHPRVDAPAAATAITAPVAAAPRTPVTASIDSTGAAAAAASRETTSSPTPVGTEVAATSADMPTAAEAAT